MACRGRGAWRRQLSARCGVGVEGRPVVGVEGRPVVGVKAHHRLIGARGRPRQSQLQGGELPPRGRSQRTACGPLVRRSTPLLHQHHLSPAILTSANHPLTPPPPFSTILDPASASGLLPTRQPDETARRDSPTRGGGSDRFPRQHTVLRRRRHGAGPRRRAKRPKAQTEGGRAQSRATLCQRQ